MEMIDRGLSEEQKLMRETCRGFVNDLVIPFMRRNWQREWLMDPDARLPREILEQADRIGIRTLGVPEEFGGIQLDPATEVQTFASFPRRSRAATRGLPTSWCRSGRCRCCCATSPRALCSSAGSRS